MSDAQPMLVQLEPAACRQGKYHLDPDVRFLSMPGTHGALADYFDHSADFVGTPSVQQWCPSPCID